MESQGSIQGKIQMNDFFSLENPVFRLVIALFVLGSFFIFYHFYLIPQQNFLRDYTEVLARFSAIPIRWFGYQVDVMQFQDLTSSWLYLDKVPSVEVGYVCCGFNIICVFGVFLFMFRGDWKFKILYFIVGFLIIYLANTIRIAALAVNYIKDKESMEFNHKYTYTIIIYGIIGILWYVWLKKFSVAKEQSKQ